MDYYAAFTGLMVVVGAMIGWHFRANIAEDDLRMKQTEIDRLKFELADMSQQVLNAREMNAIYRRNYR